MYQSLELIVRHFAAPHKALAIRIEPRVVHRESGSVTAWDVLIETDAIAWEAKLNVTKQDVIEWLQRIENTGEPKAATKFGLVRTHDNLTIIHDSCNLPRSTLQK